MKVIRLARSRPPAAISSFEVAAALVQNLRRKRVHISIFLASTVPWCCLNSTVPSSPKGWRLNLQYRPLPRQLRSDWAGRREAAIWSTVLAASRAEGLYSTGRHHRLAEPLREGARKESMALSKWWYIRTAFLKK